MVMLLALLLAFSIWLIHNLALRYNDYLKVSVVALCNLDGHVDVSANKCEVMARCRTTGYNVLKYNFKANKKSKTIQFNPAVMKHKSDDIFYVTSSDLQEYSHLIFGDNANVEYFVSDTLFFRFPEVHSKKVPVVFVHAISFASQYINDGPVTCVPDSIIVTGEKHLLDNLNQVFTMPIKHSDLSEDVKDMVEIEKIRGVRYSVPEVLYNLNVTRYVELKRTYIVKAINVPPDKKLVTYPSTVEAVFKCRFPISSDPTMEVDFQVDYDAYMNSQSGKCSVNLSKLPESVISYNVAPALVDCVLEER